MADVMTNAKNKAQSVGNACADMAQDAADECRSAAGYVADQVKDAANQASKAGAYIESRAEDATSSIGSGLKAAGESVRNYAPQDGRLGQASSAVAQTLSQTGDYIEREGLGGIANDIATLIKKNPIPTLLLGIGLGFLIASATARK